MRRFALRSLSALLLAVAVAAIIAAPSALSAKDPQDLTITAVLKSKGGGPQPAVTVGSITCTHSIGNPHKSTHVPSTVNVVSKIVCSAPVGALSINPINLYRNFSLVATGTNFNQGKAIIQANAATNGCIPANYDGQSTATILFPPGFSPQTWSGRVSSNLVFVSCL